jgi:hypothetical protein
VEETSVKPQVGEVWMAIGEGNQRAYYLTLELTPMLRQSSGITVPYWTCLYLENGRVALTSLGTDDSSVMWERIA